MTRSSYRKGLWSESLCCLALRLKFYRILARRHKTPVGEIDIIAARGNTVVAVEVKARSSRAAAAEALSGEQQRRIARALQFFLASAPRHAKADLRFDVMLVAPRHWPTHIKNAWVEK